MSKLLAALLVVVSFNANAEAIAYTKNVGGGKIVLTDLKCKNNLGLIAYTSHPSSNTVYGCWFSDDVSIHVNWGSNGTRSYDYVNWEFPEKSAPVAPKAAL